MPSRMFGSIAVCFKSSQTISAPTCFIIVGRTYPNWKVSGSGGGACPSGYAITTRLQTYELNRRPDFLAIYVFQITADLEGFFHVIQQVRGVHVLHVNQTDRSLILVAFETTICENSEVTFLDHVQ